VKVPSAPLQRDERASRQAVTSPFRLSRREVTVPCRVLSGNGVAGLLGYLLPVRSWRSLEHSTLPVFPALPMPEEATPGAILSWGSVLLYGMSRCLRLQPLDRQAPLLGFCAPSALEEEGVHGPPVARRAPRLFCRGIRQRVPSRQLRCRSQVFSTSQRPSSSLRRPAVFRQVALIGFCPSGVFRSRRPGSSSPPACPLDVSPIGRPSPLPRRGSLRARLPRT
jgi:hypothetical protein